MAFNQHFCTVNARKHKALRALKHSFGVLESVKVNFFKEEPSTLRGSRVIGSNKNNTH